MILIRRPHNDMTLRPHDNDMTLRPRAFPGAAAAQRVRGARAGCQGPKAPPPAAHPRARARAAAAAVGGAGRAAGLCFCACMKQSLLRNNTQSVGSCVNACASSHAPCWMLGHWMRSGCARLQTVHVPLRAPPHAHRTPPHARREFDRAAVPLRALPHIAGTTTCSSDKERAEQQILAGVGRLDGVSSGGSRAGHRRYTGRVVCQAVYGQWPLIRSATTAGQFLGTMKSDSPRVIESLSLDPLQTSKSIPP